MDDNNDSKKYEDAAPCKVILVGDSGVGKTSIVARYLDRYQKDEKSTIGVSYSNKIIKIENNTLCFDIWDTAGQEKFRSVNSVFYRDAHLCILVYDITCQESFENLKTYWYPTVNENATGDIIFGIAGNKQDLFEDEKVNQQDVRDFASDINAIFYLTSAKEGTAVDKIFTELAQKFVESPNYTEIINKIKNKTKLENVDDTNENKKKRCCG